MLDWREFRDRVVVVMASLPAQSNFQLSRTFDAVLMALAAGLSLGIAVWLLSDGLTEHSTLLFTRYTARLSFMFFLPVFTLHAIQVLLPTILGRALLKKRRQLGLAFAFVHFIHLAAIVMHFKTMDQWFTLGDTPALVIYLLIGVMAVTSNTFSMVKLRAAWRILHKVGLYGVFIGFFTTYLGRVQEFGVHELHPAIAESLLVYVVLLVMVSGALLLRVLAFWKLRSEKAANLLDS